MGLLGATMADGLTAATIILTMSFGLIVPKLAADYVCDRLAYPQSESGERRPRRNAQR
jgi:hypothetical protein